MCVPVHANIDCHACPLIEKKGEKKGREEGREERRKKGGRASNSENCGKISVGFLFPSSIKHTIISQF